MVWPLNFAGELVNWLAREGSDGLDYSSLNPAQASEKSRPDVHERDKARIATSGSFYLRGPKSQLTSRDDGGTVRRLLFTPRLRKPQTNAENRLNVLVAGHRECAGLKRRRE